MSGLAETADISNKLTIIYRHGLIQLIEDESNDRDKRLKAPRTKVAAKCKGLS